MSTSFDIIPGKINITDTSLLLRLNERLEEYLISLNIHKHINFQVYKCNQNEKKEINLLEQLFLLDSEYLYVTISCIDGGFFIFQYNNDDIYKELWMDELKREQSIKYKHIILESFSLPYHWNIVRYAGTHPIYNLSYGLCASVMAELTSGLIFSDDNAWDYSCFPCLSYEFNHFYFKPDFCNRKEDKKWVKENLNTIKNMSKI